MKIDCMNIIILKYGCGIKTVGKVVQMFFQHKYETNVEKLPIENT